MLSTPKSHLQICEFTVILNHCMWKCGQNFVKIRYILCKYHVPAFPSKASCRLGRKKAVFAVTNVDEHSWQESLPQLSSFKKLSWIYIIRNNMHIKIFCRSVFWEKTLHFPALFIQPRCCGILPCHCGGLCPPCAVTTFDSLLVLLLLRPDTRTLSHNSDTQKNNFPWGSSARSQLTPQAFAHRLFWTIILLQKHSTFECLSPNLVKFG